MAITIKNIRTAAVTNLIILGLVGCSSSPAPWTQANDDDPWGSKREAEAQNTLPDEVVLDTSLNDPILLSDPEPEPIVMQEPEWAPAPEVIVPVVVEDLTPEQEVMTLAGSDYAVQAYASKTFESAENFKSNNGLDNLMTIKTDRAGAIVYVVVDIYPDRSTANAAAVDIEAKTGSKPWVRSLAGLQNIVAQ